MEFKDTLRALRDTLETVDPSKLQGIDGVYQLILTGGAGGIFQVRVQSGKAELMAGAPNTPDITFTISETDFNSLWEGRLSAASAFLTGRLKIKGDLSLAFKLQGLLG